MVALKEVDYTALGIFISRKDLNAGTSLELNLPKCEND